MHKIKMEEKCPKCGNTGIVKDEKGIHACWDCLAKGKLDVHSEKLPESKIRI